VTQLALQLEPAPLKPPKDAYNVYVAPLDGNPEPSGPLPVLASCIQEAEQIAADSASVPTDRCLALPARHWSDTLLEKLSEANRRADEDLAYLKSLHAEILGIPVEKIDEHMAAEKAKEDRLRQEARAAAPARTSTRSKAAQGGDVIGIGRAALSERQRQLLAHVEVKDNVAVYTSNDRIPDWDLLKRVMLALGGTWKTGGKKAPGGFRFPDDLDAAELVRLAKESGEIIDPKVAEFFWTSDDLADELAAFVAPVATGLYLEPSAGKGALAHALRRQCGELVGASIDCFEPLDANRTVLRAAGFNLIGRDFLEFAPGAFAATYDGIIANPPFSKRADIIHITRMLDWLKPGGRLAAIASSGVKHRDDARGREFRALIASHAGVIVDNDAGSFEHAGTGVNTVRVLLTKGGAQ
jgi:hypothetical protein